VALEQWNLAAAESDFVRATSADGSFAAAHAWLAQVALWRRDLAQVDWHRHAMATTVNEWPSVASDDALRASALRSLATGDAPAACRAYNTLTARDSLDATAWLGLGDCQALDSLVVRDAKSPSGWQFRGDYDAAMRAYEHAVRANGGAYAALPFSYVRFIVNVRPNALRRGRDASGRLFLGLAAFDAGHPYYVPYAARGNGGAAGSDIAPTMLAFSRFNADRLLAFSRDWVAQVPASPDAYEALATVLEERGQLTDREDGMGISAMAALDSAMRRTHDDTRIARLTSSRVRLLVKHEEFAKAIALVDSILSVDRTPTPATADWLVGLASLTGRAAKAGELDRIAMAAATDDAGIPAPLTERITRTTVESALGVCGATMQSELDALDAAIDSYVEPARRDAVRARGVFRAWSNAVPCFGPSIVAKVPPQPDRLLTMQQALGRGQVSVVRAQLDTLARYRANARAADVSMDYSFNEAWLRHRIGDDAIATRSLDLVLGALPSISQWAVTEPVQAAAVGRTMLFRAELADAAHDRATARRWAAATLALWSHADPTLGPALARARALAK
jgi:tetratricopeptide (TPR) repeat protein